MILRRGINYPAQHADWLRINLISDTNSVVNMKNIISVQAGTKHFSNAGFEFEVLEYRSITDILVRFKDTRYTRTARASDIRNGKVRDFTAPTVFGIGFNGIGRHKSKINGKHTKAYNTWRNMLKRCYCKAGIDNAYIGCSVDSRWHDFQNYAEWHEKNYPEFDQGKKYQLDKDIMSNGEKIYSPETCKFVTQKENLEAVDNKLPVNLINLSTLEVRKYKSSTLAAADIGSDSGTISRLISGLCKQTKGWSLAD